MIICHGVVWIIVGDGMYEGKGTSIGAEGKSIDLLSLRVWSPGLAHVCL